MNEVFERELSAARRALWQLAILGEAVPQTAMRYIGLFRKERSQKLSFTEIETRLIELVAIKESCDKDAFIAGLNKVIQVSDSLNNHDALKDNLRQPEKDNHPNETAKNIHHHLTDLKLEILSKKGNT